MLFDAVVSACSLQAWSRPSGMPLEASWASRSSRTVFFHVTRSSVFRTATRVRGILQRTRCGMRCGILHLFGDDVTEAFTDLCGEPCRRACFASFGSILLARSENRIRLISRGFTGLVWICRYLLLYHKQSTRIHYRLEKKKGGSLVCEELLPEAPSVQHGTWHMDFHHINQTHIPVDVWRCT